MSLPTPANSRAATPSAPRKLAPELRALVDADKPVISNIDDARLHAYFARCKTDTADDPLRAQVWPIALMAAFLALNQPQAGAELWRWLSTTCAGEERIKLARRIREVPYKATSLVALPLAINAATVLRDAMDDELLAALGEDPRRIDADNYAATLDRARSFWSRIYATFAERAHDRIYKAMPPIMRWITLCSYGVLSDTTYLEPSECSVVIVSSLRGAGGLHKQLLGHVHALVSWPGWNDDQAIWLLSLVDATRRELSL